MKLSTPFAVMAGLLMPLSIKAQVDNSQIIPFQAGTPARAADMNQNVDELIRAINANTAQLKELQEQMSIMASFVNLPKPTLQQDLSGSVYKLGFFSASLGSDTGTATGVWLTETAKMRSKIFGSESTLTLNSDGTVTMALDEKERESNIIATGYFYDFDIDDLARTRVNISTTDVAEVVTLTGTWSLSGNILTLNLDGDLETFYVSVDGNTIFNNGKDTEVDEGINMFSSSMDLGVRILKPQPNIEVKINHLTRTNNQAAVLINGSDNVSITIENSGTADLVLGSSSLIQDMGSDLTFTAQSAPITIAPGADHILILRDPPSAVGSNRKDGTIYLMSNDPDTPTFLVNVFTDNNP